MTTIAYRAGVLAGDSRETNICEGESTVILNNTCKKIYRLPSGNLLGGSGGSEPIERLRLALVKGQPAPQLDGLNGLLIDTSGHIWLYEGNIWQRVRAKYYAVGSGAAFALAAMDAGATAVEAVRIGIKRDPYSGGKVRSLKL